MRRNILHGIYRVFETWSQTIQPACSKGCSSCCTRNVNITALEGEEILDYILATHQEEWMAKILADQQSVSHPVQTTNDFAHACLKESKTKTEPAPDLSPCPFLEANCCRIYPVRPFSCRLFLSTAVCSASQPADLPNHYIEAATATSQLIEHLGQKEYWGNMLDVLPALLDISTYSSIGKKVGALPTRQAHLRLLTAKPLPGFLISEEAGPEVSALLETIFSTEVHGISIEDFLNGQRE